MKAKKSWLGIGMTDDAEIKVDLEGFTLFLSGMEEARMEIVEKLIELTDLSDEKIGQITEFNTEFVKNTRLELQTK